MLKLCIRSSMNPPTNSSLGFVLFWRVLPCNMTGQSTIAHHLPCSEFWQPRSETTKYINLPYFICNTRRSLLIFLFWADNERTLIIYLCMMDTVWIQFFFCLFNCAAPLCIFWNGSRCTFYKTNYWTFWNPLKNFFIHFHSYFKSGSNIYWISWAILNIWNVFWTIGRANTWLKFVFPSAESWSGFS